MTSRPCRLPPLDELENLTDLTEIQRAHDLLLAEEQALDTEIQELLSKQSFVDAQLKVLFDIPVQLEPLLADVGRLDDSLRDVSRLADEISLQVRHLDQLQDRIGGAMKKTNDIIDLKNCIDGVQNAMASEDYAAAANYVHRYLHFDKSILDRESVELLETAERSLLEIIRLKCDSAVMAGDTENVFKFGLLFPLIGHPQMGIDKISAHLGKVLAKDEQAIYAEMEKATKAAASPIVSLADQKISYAAAVAQLLQRLERRLKRFRQQIEAAFGRKGLAQILVHVQSSVNERGLNILELFIREWQVQQTLSTINRQQTTRQGSGITTALSRASGTPSLEYRDPREYAPLLDQIVVISQSFEVYSRFASALINAPVPAAAKQQEQTQANNGGSGKSEADSNGDEDEAVKNQLLSQLHRSFYQSKLNERLHEVLGWYVRLEQYYMDEAVKMAVVEDQVPTAQQDDDDTAGQTAGQTSSIVDDVFFVVKECLQRAQLTYNVNTICAIINLADQQLGSLFLDTLAHNSKQASTLQATLSRKAQATPLTLSVALNNLEQSIEYIKRLKAEMDSSIEKQFAGQDKDLQKISAVLDEIHSTEKRFNHVLHGNVELLASSILPRLQASFEQQFADVSYVLTEEQYAQNQINDPFMAQFIAELDAALVVFQKFLSPGNLSLMYEIVARNFAEQIEAHLLVHSGTGTVSSAAAAASGSSSAAGHIVLKKFNLLGAQQFERDIRALVEFFNKSLLTKTIRDKFARINQIAFILALEKESEIMDYWGSKAASGLAWRLSTTEVRRVLALRVDFSREAIVKLKL